MFIPAPSLYSDFFRQDMKVENGEDFSLTAPVPLSWSEGSQNRWEPIQLDW
jgi:hypothetical protein